MVVVEVGIVHGSLPSFRSRGGGEILRAAITHYNGNIAEYRITMSVSMLYEEFCKSCPKGAPWSCLYRWLDLGLQEDNVTGKSTES